jgi:hypothetical protein
LKGPSDDLLGSSGVVLSDGTSSVSVAEEMLQGADTDVVSKVDLSGDGSYAKKKWISSTMFNML